LVVGSGFWLNDPGRVPRASIKLRHLGAGLLLAGVVVCPGAAWAADEQEYELIKTLVQDTQHEQAAARAARLLDPASPLCPNTPDLSPQGCHVTDPGIVLRVRGYYAIALQSTGKNEAAKVQFRAILKDNPTFSPSPAIYPIKVIDLFNEVKQESEAAQVELIRKRQAEIEAARAAQKRYDNYVAELEKRAGVEERVIERSRWFAAVPFGVGQFYNDDVGLGVLFASVEGSAAVTAIVTATLHAEQSVLLNQNVDLEFYPRGFLEVDPVKKTVIQDRLDQLRIANYVSMATLGVAIVAGFIEAQVSFRGEERRVVPRALPPKPPKPAPPTLDLIGVPGSPSATGLGVQLSF
jgi:hypothetical protein